MAKKAKKKAGSSGATNSKVGKAVKTAKSFVGKVTGTKTDGKRSRKKGALWYAKEIQRLKLKKRYEKVKFRV